MVARKAPLRAVVPGDRPPPARGKTVTQAVRTGDAREVLVAMRDRMAKAVDKPDIPFRELHGLMNQLMLTVEKIEAMDASANEEPPDPGEVEQAADEPFDSSAV